MIRISFELQTPRPPKSASTTALSGEAIGQSSYSFAIVE